MHKSRIVMAIAACGVLVSAMPGESVARKRNLKVPALVNVDLTNVLNKLSVRLHLDRTNVPVNAQVPITVAANVCGVSVNVLAVSAANGKGSCVAKTASPKLAQVVQQQISAGGNVGGGAQGSSTATTSGSPAPTAVNPSQSTPPATPTPPATSTPPSSPVSSTPPK